MHKKDRNSMSEEWKKWIREIVGENKKVLDFGCARGLLSREMLPYSKRVMGMDFSPVFVQQAKNNLGKDNVILGDVCNPPDSLPKDFDVVWCIEVIEHVLEPAKLIQQAAEHLTESGRLVLTFPKSKFTGRNPNRKDIDRHLWCFDEAGIMELTEPYFVFERCYHNLFWVFSRMGRY
jgi:2-polyprenyl-3-methyl-5-hydroxy-6-metoxy-1,4-benzoquinol methylase